MADVPNPTEQAHSKPQRDEKGRLLPGQTANAGGRPKLPDWLKGRSEKALTYIADVADGTEPAEPEMRLKAAVVIVERYYGKPQQAVQVDGSVAVTPLAQAMQAIAEQFTAKTTETPDAEPDDKR